MDDLGLKIEEKGKEIDRLGAQIDESSDDLEKSIGIWFLKYSIKRFILCKRPLRACLLTFYSSFYSIWSKQKKYIHISFASEKILF